jgi:hypothetical protein
MAIPGRNNRKERDHDGSKNYYIQFDLAMGKSILMKYSQGYLANHSRNAQILNSPRLIGISAALQQSKIVPD